MPNNSAAGMLETFCANLIPEEQQKSWQQADAAMKLARGVGAPWRDCHSSKAQIHTWLAWQDPPGERIGIALTKKTLDPQSSGSQKFVEWFKKLYRFD